MVKRISLLSLLGLLVLYLALSCRDHVPLPPVQGPPLAVPEAKQTPLAALKDQPLRIIQASPEGQQGEPHVQIVVSFSKPMVALSRVEAQAETRPLTITPPVEGEQRWLGSRTLTLASTKPLPGATTFTVTVPAGVKALDGTALDKAHTFTFTTPLLAVSRDTPGRGENHARPDVRPELFFNQPVDRALLQSKVRVLYRPSTEAGKGPGTAASVQVVAGRSDRHFVLHPKAAFPLDSEVTIEIPGDLTGLEGPLPMGKPFLTAFRTYGPFRVKGLSCTKDCSPDDSVRLDFSNPVSRSKARKAVKINGVALGSSGGDWSDESLYLDAESEARTSYTVTVDPTLRDEFGQKLMPVPPLSFTTGDYSPTVYFPLYNGVVEAASTLRLPVYFRNADSATLYSKTLTDGEVASLLGHERYWSDSETLLTELSGSGQQSLKVRGQRNKRLSHPVDLKKLLGKEHGVLALELDAQLDDGKEKTRRVQRAVVRITDLAVHAKHSPRTSLIWVTSLKSGQPVENATVSILRTGDSSILWKGKTDAAGLAEGPGALALGADEERSFLFFAEKDGDRSYVPSSSSSGISPWDFGLDATWEDEEQPLHGLMFTDRGLYRPGETVYLKGVLRRDDKGKLVAPSGGTAALEVSDARGDKLELKTDEADISEFGTFSVEITLPASAPLGDYSVVAKPDGGGSVYGSFRVEEFRAAEFKVELETAARELVRGDTLKWSARAAYLFGAPMRKSPISHSLYRNPSFFSPPGHEGYVFSDEIWWWGDGEERRSGGFIGSGKGQLSDAGAYENQALLKPASMTGPETYDLEAQVTDISRQNISARAQVLLHPGEVYLGGKPEETFVTAGKPLKTQVLAVAPDGTPREGVTITGTLYRREWFSVRKQGMGGNHYFVSRPREIPVGTCLIKTRKTSVPCDIVVPQAGYFVLRLVGQDRRGNPLMSSFGVYAEGADYVPWRRDGDDRVELVLDRDEYKVGQTARLLVKSPYREAQGLLTVERNGIFLRKAFKLERTSAWLQVPITAELLPNAFVSVVLVRGRIKAPPPSGKNTGYEDEDPGKPSLKVGYATLAISHEDHRLKVKVSSQKETYKPGDEAVVDLELRDAASRPLKGELTVVVADEGVLSLLGYSLPDPMAVFYASRGLSVRTADNRLDLISPRVFGEKGNNPGGGGSEEGASEGGGVRRNFVSTPYFNPRVLTDEQGRATVRFKLPDNLTTFRVMVMAVGPEADFGQGRSSFKVSKPLLLLPALPRFVRVGDSVEAGVVVHNNSPSSGPVKVTATVQGLVLQGSSEETLDLKSESSGEASFRFQADKPGEAVFRFSAVIGDFRDTLELRRPVRLPLVAETVATYGSTEGAVAEGLAPASGIRSDVGGLELAMSSSALVGLQGGLGYLLDYPYECLEQSTSRLVPLVLLRDLRQAFKLGPEGGAAELVAKILGRIQTLQRWDGGFSFWPESEQSTPWGSAYATWGLLWAKEAGHPVSQKTLDQARSYLKAQLRRTLPDGQPDLELSVRTYIVSVLAALGEKVSGDLATLYEKRSSLPIFGRALLLSAVQRAGGDPEMKATLLREVAASVHQTAKVAKVEENLGDGYAPYFHSSNRSTAMVLLALLAAQPDHPLCEKMVRFLLDERREGHWRNTQETAYALMAIHAYYKAREATVPDFVARVFLGEAEIVQKTFKGRSLEVQKSSITMDKLQKAQGSGVLGFVKEGSGRLYYSAQLKYARTELPKEPWDQGFFVTRRYEVVEGTDSAAGLLGEDSGAGVTTVKAGDLVRVTLEVVAPQQMFFVAVDDPLPAGLEAVNFRLMTASRSEQRRYQHHGSTSRYGRGGRRSSMYSPFYQQMMRDDRVQVFADSLAPGAYTYVYLARATSPGRFVVPPTQVEQMYEPESFGRTGTTTLEVKR